ncbi:MFS general substrate transporter [Cylindrobasidium torrendii FP15055 ss-10]|uniref:MFS general substrate transporter n=1 Tax=Cylindrobasidium torrendii FP15055 ss-10 TaxID=1314674 RepID=A0A0D7B372_9AGAR|nr:MFS general substrate transporter [Cylindrobasidium torrendii FP15055 ss-10]
MDTSDVETFSHSDRQSIKDSIGVRARTESTTVGHDSRSNSDWSVSFRASEGALIRRVDWRMLPLLGFLYSVTIIDRSNMGIARTAGMGDELGLDIGNRFSVASCIYFVPYIVLQLPMNLVLRRFGARNCLTFYICGWGCVLVGMGLVKDWRLLVMCRVLLGALEAGFFPALIYIVSTWYTRAEVQTRIAAFLQASIAISGFGAILSYGLTKIGRVGKYQGWSWIFIVEGLITVGCGILGYAFIPDFPDKNTFLSKKETEIILRRVEDDRGDSVPDAITLKSSLHHLKDWVVWAHAIMYMAATMPSYAGSFFTPVILYGMGEWTQSEAILLSAPPLVACAISAFAIAWISDKTGHRAGFIVLQAVMTIIGVLITCYASQNGVRYAGIFIFSCGAAGNMSALLAYNANNIAGQSKRSVCSGLLVSFGGIGGILGTTVFRQADYPRYIPGTWAVIGAQILMLVLLAAVTWTYSRRNALARRTGIPLEGQHGFLYIL